MKSGHQVRKLSVDRTEQLLDAADALFGRYGYERTKMDDIATEAGISKGAVYLAFKSKEDLLIAVVHRNMQAQLDGMQMRLDRCEKDFLPCLKNTLKDNILFAFDRVQAQHHSLESLVRTGHRIRQNSLPHFKKKWGVIADFLEKAALAREIPQQTNYQAITYYLFTSLSGLYPPYEPKNTLRPDSKISRDDLANAAEAIMILFFAGLKTADLGHIKHALPCS